MRFVVSGAWPRRVFLCLVLMAGWICGAGMRAQTSADGAVRGVVLDASGAVIPSARIHLREASTGLLIDLKTDNRGEFVAVRLAPGEYTVTAEAAGFAPAELTRIEVELGGFAEVRLQLRNLTASTTIAVSSKEQSEPGLDSVNSVTLNRTISQEEIVELPVNSRSWQSFTLELPLANLDEKGAALVSFRGLSSATNRATVDGMSDDQSYNGVPRGGESAASEEGSDERERTANDRGASAGARWHTGTVYTFSQVAMREFRIGAQNETALYGQGSGGIISVLTRGGGDKLHGTLFYINREGAWGAADPFSIATRYNSGAPMSEIVKPHDLRQQFGGRVGGPLLRNKLFYLYAFDGQRRSFPAVTSPADTAFYALTPTQKALLANRGVTSAKINAALSYLDSLTGKVDRRHDQAVNFARIDWQAAQEHRISLQYNRVRSSAPAGMRTAPVVNRGSASLGSAYSKVDSSVARWLWTVSPLLANELRLAYGRDFEYQQPQPPLQQEPAIGPGGYAPEVAIGPEGLTFGTPANVSPQGIPDEHRVQLADLATLSRGKHLVQSGFDFSIIDDAATAATNTEGTFHYDSGTTGGRAGGLVDWITDYTFNVNAYPNGGCPSINASVHLFCFRSYTKSFGQQKESFRTQEWAAFVEDTWRLRESLTVNAGLRYEYQLEPLPQQPNPAVDSVFGARAATSVFPEDRNNIAPRVGIAWAPWGRRQGVVRAGYGVYFGRLPGVTIGRALTETGLASSTTQVRITPSTVTACPQVANQGFGYPCSYVSAPPSAVATTTSITVFDRHLRLPMSQQLNVSVERDLGANVVLSLGYVMNLNRQMPATVDINIAPSAEMKTFQIVGGNENVGLRDGQTFALPVYTARLSSTFGPVNEIVSNGNGSYNAAIVEARRRSRRGLEFRIGWTWSKAIDYGANGGPAQRSASQLDPSTNGYDKGLSSLNYSHKFSGSIVWQPRLERGERWVRAAANGWRTSAIMVESAGRPYSYEIFGGTRLAGGRESINGSGGATYLPTIGRNTMRLPDTFHMDLRLERSMTIADGPRLEAWVEAFNLPNRTNYTAVNQRAFLVGTPTAGVTPLIFQDAATVAAEGLNTRPFGQYLAASTGLTGARQIQLGARFTF